MKKVRCFIALLTSLCIALSTVSIMTASAASSDERVNFIQAYVDRILESSAAYDLLPNGFNVYSNNPVTWVAKDGTVTTPSSIMSHQYFFRLLDGLSALTGDSKYVDYAKSQFTQYMSDENLHDSNGLFYAGNHRYYDLNSEEIFGSVTNSYEHKYNFPYYDLMFETDKTKSADFIEAYWNAMVSDWEKLLFSRHGEFNKEIADDVWANTYDASHDLWLANTDAGLSFINAGTDLIYSGVKYYQQTGNQNALTWVKRLWNEYYQVSDQNTKILVYQYTKLDSGDRGLAQFASSDYGDRALEGKVLTRGIASSIYGIAVPVMVQLAVELGDEEWLSQLKASYEGFVDYAYNEETKQFKPILSDGTDLTGYVADVDGYFFDKGETLTEYDFTTDMKTGLLYVAAMTGSEKLWSVARSNYTSLGDIGSEPGKDVDLKLTTNTANAQYALSFLYLYDKTGVEDYLNMALRICDNMKTYSYSNGYYLKESGNANNNEYINASVNVLAPLVTLKAAAYALGTPEAVPDFPVSTGGFLDDFSGETGKRATDQDFTFKQKKSDTTSKVVNLLTNELYYLPSSINGHPVTWADGATVVDTTETGTYTYYGTSTDNITCILIANVSGYSYYEDFQTRTPDTTPGSSGTDVFRIDSSDTSEAIKYMYTDSENENIALRFDCSTAARSAFVPFSETYSGNGVEVGFKLKVDLGTATTGYVRVRTVASEGNSLETRLNRNSDGTYTVNHFNGLTKISNADTACSTDWVIFKYVFNLPEKTYDVYINGTKVNQTSYTCLYDTITQLHISGRTTGIIAYIDDVYMKNSLSSNAEGVLTLELDTADLSFDVLQGESVSAQELSYNIINSDGEDTGLDITKTVDMDIDTSYVGTFNRELDIDGQTVPYTVTVSKLSQLVFESFQEYEDEVVATNPRPYYSPYNSDKSPTTDQVIFDTDGNKVGAINEDGNRKWTRFNTGATSAGGKFSFAYKLKLDTVAETSAFSQFTVAIANTDNETNFLAMHFIKDNTTGALSFKAGNTTIYPELSYGGWISVSGIIDIDNLAYSVTCNGKVAEGLLDSSIVSGAAEFRFGDRTSTTESYSAQHLIDDIELSSYLKVSFLKQAQTTVYLGDDAQLPETVETVLSDGMSVSSLPVIWNGSVSTNAVGTQELTGSVPGAAGYTPSLSVTITDLPYRSDGILVHNKDGYTMMSLAEGAAVKGITLKKISQSTYDSKIYIGIFHEESGKLLQSKACTIDAANISWAKGESKYFDVDMQLDLPDGIDAADCTAQAFVLTDTLKPLTTKAALRETIDSATIWLAGDSITCEYAESQKPETGWGEKLVDQFSNVTVYNEALGGQSTKSFYDQNRLQKILANSNPGDYLFIMFGINDDKDEEYRHTEPGTTYNEYLKKFISEAREYGMIPVLLTSSERFTAFKADGSVVSTMGEYPEATRTVAKEENVPLIDVHSKILTDMAKQGKANYQKYYMVFDAGIYENYPNGSSDTTHLRPEGAELVTSFVMEGIKELNLPLAALCVE